MLKLALVSPNKDAYPETFIQAHKNIPGVELHYLYGGMIPKESERYGVLRKFPPIQQRLFYKVLRKPYPKSSEYGFELYLKEHKIEAVLAEYGLTGVAVLPVCQKLGIPLFVYFHGYDASAHQVIRDNGAKYRQMFAYASRIFVVSKVMYRRLVELGCPEEKLILNTYGPDDRFLEIEPKNSDPRAFIAIGRFVNKKAPYYTILAFKKVVEKYPDARLYFAGDGELRELCQNLIRHFRLEENIQLLGVITPEVYASFLECVSGFIQHSITAENGDMEGTPVAVLEASAAGIPVIATKHAGIPDVILDGETGLLVDEHDVDGMAERMIQIIENPYLARQLGATGKERIRQHFSMEQHLRKIGDVLCNGI